MIFNIELYIYFSKRTYLIIIKILNSCFNKLYRSRIY